MGAYCPSLEVELSVFSDLKVSMSRYLVPKSGN